MRNNRGILVLVGLFSWLIVPAPAGLSQSLDESGGSEYVRVTAVGPEGGWSGAGAGEALAALTVGALRARGVRARVEPPPRACAPPAAADGRACRGALLAALASGALHAALMPAPAADAADAFALRDLGIEDVGDAAPLSRRGCYATRPPDAPASPPPARSLLDFADASLAARYRLADRDIVAAVRRSSLTNNETCSNCTFVNMASFPEWCSEETCATLLTSDEAEATVLEAVIREHRLLARVACLGAELAGAAGALATPAVLCERAPTLTLPDRLRVAPLGPPFCTDVAGPCPFEPRRLVKLVNAPALAPLSPRALHVLARLTLSAPRLRELVHEARESGTEEAVRRFLAAHSGWPGGPAGEVRVGVLLPLSGTREAYDASSLAAAAELAEEDAATVAGGAGAGAGDVTFKVELFDDGCAATNAFKYLTDSLGTEYHALSGVSGPACGAAFADVARQSPTHRLPVVAYTWQAAPAMGRYAVLAAGEARRGVEAAAALVAALGWRRVAVLSELATRATLDVVHLRADVVVHVELPDDTRQPLYELVTRWAERVSSVNGRVLYVCVEDARVVRAALCAGRRAGLVPRAGAVWLLPATLPPRWLEPRPDDTHPCTGDQLAEVAAGHLSVAPAWLAAWDDDVAAPAPASAGPQRAAWEARWRARCLRATHTQGDCTRPGPHAALLYDTLRLWAAALTRMLAARPAALDDLHDEAFIRDLIENATTVPFTGLTGPFTWSSEGCNGGRARSAPLIVRQWQGAGAAARRVARWTRAGGLQLDAALLRWQTADGAAPDDGGERCGLQPLADLLHTDCRTAFVALAALVLVLLVAALAAAALHCKRRAEREYRARLAVLGLRTLSPKPGGLDKWEVPRERVVINRKLGTGAFGTVYGGHALLAEDRGWSAVAVKTLKAGADTEEKLDFLSEAEAMKRFDHKNVVRLLGVVTKTEPVCTVMEFMLYGDLKNYLLARRHLAAGLGGGGGRGGEGDADEVSAARLTSMALDAARALSYLAQLRYVHRDVAARNCLVSAHRIVKLADFGMTRLVFENDYYRFSRKGMLPVRWMAPESLALGVFSPASDVWSFGVLLYEIVTFGSLPFQGLSNAEVLARVKAGHTLDLPPGLKPQLEGLIKSCWRQEHKARPGAAEVAAFLADSPRLLTPCLDVPLDALPLDAEAEGGPDAAWRLPRDRAEARWVSWAAPASATTDTTYLSAEPPPQDTDAFLP